MINKIQTARSEKELRIGSNIPELPGAAELVDNRVNHLYFSALLKGMVARGDVADDVAAGIQSRLVNAVKRPDVNVPPSMGDAAKATGNEAFEREGWQEAMSQYQNAQEATKNFHDEFSSIQVDQLLRWAEFHEKNAPAGRKNLQKILASMLSARKEFTPVLINTMAYADPKAFDELRVAMTHLRSLEGQDPGVEEALLNFAKDNSLNPEEVLRVALYTDPLSAAKAQLKQLAAQTNKGGLWKSELTGLRAWGSLSKATWAVRFSSVENMIEGLSAYRQRTFERNRNINVIASAISGTVNGPASSIIWGAIDSVALRPDSTPETVSSQAYMEQAKATLKHTIEDKTHVKDMLAKLNAERSSLPTPLPPLDMTNEADLDAAAEYILNADSKTILDKSGKDQVGFFADLWRIMSNFTGLMFGTAERNKIKENLKP